MAPTDAELVRRCLDGERTGWAALLGRYADLVHSILFRAGLDRATAADAFQEVSILLWRRLSRLRRAESLLPWIATTTRRVAWRTAARARSRAARDADVARDALDAARAPVDSLAALEDEQAVRRALASIGERCRRLLSALYFHSGDESYDEIAGRLEIPRGSIGPTRKRCLERLRRALLALGFNGDGVSGTRSDVSTPPRDVVRPRLSPRRGTT